MNPDTGKMHEVSSTLRAMYEKAQTLKEDVPEAGLKIGDLVPKDWPMFEVGELIPKPAEIAGIKIMGRLGLGRLKSVRGTVLKLAMETLAKTPFTQHANMTGQPAMSVPLSMHGSGLPCGVHFVAPFGDEATLFRIASQLEQEKPWFDKKPSMGNQGQAAT